MLRPGLLAGLTIQLHDGTDPLAAALTSLGATVNVGSPPAPGADPPLDRVGVLVADARGAFAAAGGGYDGVRAAVDGAFAAARDAAVAHWIDRDGGGKLVLLAPPPGAGEHAGVARAALENVARTLSTEWARHGVTTVAVLPGDATGEPALADLVGWLASPAGAYVSGTALTLDALA